MQGVGDVFVTCNLPPNTLTTTQVGTAGPGTTVGSGSTTTTTTTTGTAPPSDTVQCSADGTATFKPAITTQSSPVTKSTSTKLTIDAALPTCSGGPSGLKAPAQHGTFKASATIRTAKGQSPPTCASLQQPNTSILFSSTQTKLLNGKKSVASLKATATLGPIETGGANVSFDVEGIVTTKGLFRGKPLHGHFVTNLTASSFATACNTGVTTLRFAVPSTLRVGTAPAPPPTTTTTSTVAPTTTLAPTTTTTTQPANPIPPEVAQAITQACNDLAATVGPLGVNLGPLTIACAAVVNGQGPLLFQAFLNSPQLGCLLLAGFPLASDPQVAQACIDFATAIQPYSSIIGGLIPV